MYPFWTVIIIKELDRFNNSILKHFELASRPSQSHWVKGSSERATDYIETDTEAATGRFWTYEKVHAKGRVGFCTHNHGWKLAFVIWLKTVLTL